MNASPTILFTAAMALERTPITCAMLAVDGGMANLMSRSGSSWERRPKGFAK
jgi:hypothetical protein